MGFAPVAEGVFLGLGLEGIPGIELAAPYQPVLETSKSAFPAEHIGDGVSILRHFVPSESPGDAAPQTEFEFGGNGNVVVRFRHLLSHVGKVGIVRGDMDFAGSTVDIGFADRDIAAGSHERQAQRLEVDFDPCSHS